MSKFKNIGKKLKFETDGTGSKNPKNLMRYGDKSKRTSKKNLSAGAFGNPLGAR